MWRLFIAHNHAAAAIGFAHGLPLHQQRDPRGQSVDLTRLRRDHPIQFIGQSFQMRQPLFDFRAHLAPFPVPG